ncbi:MAG: LacI family DNA-binding transcriptional regulator [Gammaproteobacteria bacterium]
MAATIKDVARHAKVSVASVSRALNGKGVITPSTRKRILRAAEKLHYVPHAAARTLSTRRTQTIGAVLPDIYGEFFSELIRGIDQAARRHGLHVLVTGSHGDAAEAEAAVRAMAGRVDGLLMMSPYLDSGLLNKGLRARAPIVLMNSRDKERALASLTVDNYEGAFAMVRHLAGLGHRRIAHITGPADNFDARERLRGYRAAIAELQPGAPAAVLAGDFTRESGYAVAQQILRDHSRPDVIFAANDMMAIGCLFALTEAGVRVPDEIAITGFDDIPIARFVTPPLTTVRVDITGLGSRAVERLVAAIEAKGVAPSSEVVKSELVVRVSCGAARTKA